MSESTTKTTTPTDTETPKGNKKTANRSLTRYSEKEQKATLKERYSDAKT